MHDSYLYAAQFLAMSIGAIIFFFLIPSIAPGSSVDTVKTSQGMLLAAAVVAFGGGAMFWLRGWLVSRFY